MNTTVGLRCPICANKLYLKGKSCTCGRHNYDVSKEGYLNLVHNKSNSGDNKDMILCRRNFLDGNYYKPISDRLNLLISRLVSNNGTVSISDMGCGEGYYLNNLFEYLLQNGVYSTCYGLDLSKTAIRIASKRYIHQNWLVANLSKMPFLDSSMDILISMFANLHSTETIRTLKDGGYLVLVRSGLNHLLELRRIIYPKIIERYTKTECPKGFEIVEEDRVQFNVHIDDAQQVRNLLAMTPHYWKVSAEYRERLYSMNELSTTADVEFYILKKVSKTY